MIEEGNRTYLENVSIDVAQQFQTDNPHVTVFFQGLLLDAAIEKQREHANCDFDAEKRARMRVASTVIGTPAHLYAVKTPKTIH
jgi:hypothetical protein